MTLPLILLAGLMLPAVDPRPTSTRDALKPFNLFVGKWKGTGVPDAVGGSRIKEFWTETVEWTWRFKGDDACLIATFEKSPRYKSGELRYDPEKKQYLLTFTINDGRAIVFSGTLAPGKGREQILTLERTDDDAKINERLVVTLLHANRYLYRFETKPLAAASYSRQFQVGVTKEGEEFAAVVNGPECIVSGGTGTSRVVHDGKTYYVCCSGCRDAFKENPEKFIKEYEARLKAEAEKKKKSDK